MFSKRAVTSILIAGVAALFLFSSLKWDVPPVQNKEAFIAPIPHLEKLTFGFSEVLADTLWIRAVQDFDYCEAQIGENVCRNQSWLYQMLNTITDLSPSFRIVYAAGALALTVLITDIEGASKLFDKGYQAFPSDWPMSYRAGYHFLYEVQDKKKAAFYLENAAKNGGPQWLFSLAGGLYSESGSEALAERLLEDLIQREGDPTIIQRLQEKLEAQRAKR